MKVKELIRDLLEYNPNQEIKFLVMEDVVENTFAANTLISESYDNSIILHLREEWKLAKDAEKKSQMLIVMTYVLNVNFCKELAK